MTDEFHFMNEPTCLQLFIESELAE